MAFDISIDAPTSAEFTAAVNTLNQRIDGIVPGAPPSTPVGKFYMPFNIFCHPDAPALGAASGTWAFPGSALSSSLIRFYFDYLPPITEAHWMVVWNPNTGASSTGIQLVQSDDGPSNIVPLRNITQANVSTPVTVRHDVTAALQALQQAGGIKNIGHRTAGNGSNGPKIYRSALELCFG
jgi:hypothetical protein